MLKKVATELHRFPEVGLRPAEPAAHRPGVLRMAEPGVSVHSALPRHRPPQPPLPTPQDAGVLRQNRDEDGIPK